jgi:predicted transglutaminase-like cysteine proteinase
MAVKSPSDVLKNINTKNKIGPVKEFNIVYDSSAETLEPIYFWILDFMNGLFKGNVEKIVDNFSATPGSEDFLRIMEKAQRMQGAVSNIFGTVNTVIKSIVNILYDLKEFEIRLADYDNLKSKNNLEAQAGLTTLKQIWMDQVDIKKGRGSINMLAQDLNFVTLRDAFMYSDSLKKAQDADLNDRVKRILLARLQEFFEWKDRSEKELRKRFKIEKSYLKAQVDSLKMYSRWAKPYLKATEDLRLAEQNKYKPELVKAFNTILFQLTLLGKNEIDTKESAIAKELPRSFEKMKFKRKYNSCVLVDFKFRGIPSRVGQNFAFGGRVEVSIKAYSLNNEELALFYKGLEDSDVEDALGMIQGMTEESLEQIKEDLDKYLKDETKEEQEKIEQKGNEDINPFSALVGKGTLWKKEAKKEGKNKDYKDEKTKELEKKGVKPDNYAEKYARELAAASAIKSGFTLYDIYKKAHGMASVPFGDQESFEKKNVKVGFSDVFKG